MEEGCGSKREVSCWTRGCLVSWDLALRGLFQFGGLADCDEGTFLSFVINIIG